MSNLKHGMRYTKFYQVWRGMRQRCNNPNSKFYNRYGGRGIFVCERWNNSFENFRDDMLYGYVEGLEIDRINNDGPYSKENCRWATPQVNCSNRKRTTRLNLPKGVQKIANKYKAQIVVDNKNYYIGLYNTPDIAHEEYMKVRLEWYGF